MITVNFHPFPVITTARLTLRPVTEADAASVYQMRTDPEVMKYIGRPLAKSIDEVKEWIKMIVNIHAENQGVLWALSLNTTGELIGTINYWQLDLDNHRAAIGYMLKTNYQGKGFMQEALTEVIDYGFNAMQLHTIEAEVTPDNRASIKILERNSFVREAYFKEKYYSNGRYTDSTTYSLLAPK